MNGWTICELDPDLDPKGGVMVIASEDVKPGAVATGRYFETRELAQEWINDNEREENDE